MANNNARIYDDVYKIRSFDKSVSSYIEEGLEDEENKMEHVPDMSWVFVMIGFWKMKTVLF